MQCQSELPILQVKWIAALFKNTPAVSYAFCQTSMLTTYLAWVRWLFGKLLVVISLCDVTAHFSAWLIYHFMPKNWIILYFFLLSFWKVWHEFNVSVFLTRKEHMRYFENWLNLTACELTLRICNFLTLPCGTYVCLLIACGNLTLSI